LALNVVLARKHVKKVSEDVSKNVLQNVVESMYFHLANGNVQPLEENVSSPVLGKNKKDVT
jgi:hypothetical protein